MRANAKMRTCLLCSLPAAGFVSKPDKPENEGFIHFIYLGTVAPSVPKDCFSGGRGINVLRLQRFDSSLKGGKGWCLFNIKFKVIPNLWSTKRYSPLPIVSFS